MERLEKAVEKAREKREEALRLQKESAPEPVAVRVAKEQAAREKALQDRASQDQASQDQASQETAVQVPPKPESPPVIAKSETSVPFAKPNEAPPRVERQAAAAPIIAPSEPLLFRTAMHIGEARGFYRWVLGIGLGFVAGGAMPPFNGVVLLLIAFPGLVWLLDGARSARQAAADGWRFGFGFFTPGLYWTALSMFVDIKQFWFMVPFALFGLPAMLACWVGLGTGLARMRLPGNCFPVASLRGIILLAACWTVGEWLRGHALTGFPWALIGYTWSGDSGILTAILQLSSVIGIYGVSLVTIVMMAGPAVLASRTPNIWQRRAPVITGLVLFFVIGAWGGHRMRAADPVWPDMRIRIVQPNIPQTANYSPEITFNDFRHVLSLAKAPAEKPLAAEVWPEAAVDYYLNRDTNARRAVAMTVPKGGVVLTGTLRASVTDPIKDVWNSVVAIDGAGNIIGSYDKNHLVPFGEYVPFRSILPINKIVADRFDFSTGPGPQTLPLQSIPPVSPIICYEAIFPHAVVDEANRPAWLLNVTNDAWFGTSIGPPQHFMISRVRAIEEGLPLLRAANTGISGVVDPHGRILKRLELGVSGILDADLPKPLPFVPLYARFGDWILLLMVIASAGLALFIRPRGT